MYSHLEHETKGKKRQRLAPSMELTLNRRSRIHGVLVLAGILAGLCLLLPKHMTVGRRHRTRKVKPSEMSYPEPLKFVEKVKERKVLPITPSGKATSLDYNVFDCPPHPPDDYPRDYPIMDVMQNWSIDDTGNKPEQLIHQGVCIFDFGTTVGDDDARSALHHQILSYRQAEVPFVIRNDSAVLLVVG